MIPEGVQLKGLWGGGLRHHLASPQCLPPSSSWKGQLGTQVAQLSAG